MCPSYSGDEEEVSQEAIQNQELISHLSCEEDIEVAVEDLSGDEGGSQSIKISLSSSPKKADMAETAVTVIKFLIGSGILSLPYTVSVMGWLLALILFLLTGVVNQYSVFVLLKVKNLSRHSSYSSVAFHIYRHKAFRLVINFLVLFTNLGFCITMFSYLKGMIRKLVADYLDDAGALEQFYTQEWFFCILVALVLLPANIVQKIESLKHTAVVGTLGLAVATVAFFVIFFDEMAQKNWENDFQMRAFPQDISLAVSSIPNIVFVLVYQMSFYSIHKGLIDCTDRRSNLANLYGCATSLLIYISVGIMGYALFGGRREININFLLMLEKDQIQPILFLSTYLGHFLSISFCIPICFFSARNNFIAIIKLLTIRQETPRQARTEFANTVQEIGSFMGGNRSVDRRTLEKAAKIRFYLYSVGLYSFVVVVAIAVSSLKAVYNLVGAVGTVSIGFVFPFLFYVLLIRKKKKSKNIYFYLCVAGLAFFIPFGVVAVVLLYV